MPVLIRIKRHRFKHIPVPARIQEIRPDPADSLLGNHFLAVNQAEKTVFKSRQLVRIVMYLGTADDPALILSHKDVA